MLIRQNIDQLAAARMLTRTQQLAGMNGSTESNASVSMIGAEAERLGCVVEIDTSQSHYDIAINGRLYEVRNVCSPSYITFGPSTGKGVNRPFNASKSQKKWRILKNADGGILVVDVRIIYAMRNALRECGNELALAHAWHDAYRLDKTTQTLEHVYHVYYIPASWVLRDFTAGRLTEGRMPAGQFFTQFPYTAYGFDPHHPDHQTTPAPMTAPAMFSLF